MEIPTIQPGRDEAGIQRYHVADLLVAPASSVASENPFDAEFSVAFRGPGGQAFTIPGFYDGDRGYLVRFSPTVEGEWCYDSRSPISALNGVRDTVRCQASDNALIHGALTVDPRHRHHFVYEDGSRCFLLGYEVNWLMMVDQSPSRLERIDAFLDSIARAGFNMVTVNAFAVACPGWLTPGQERDPRYIKPELAPWVGGNANPDYAHMDVAFFRHYDQVMLDLLQRGILAHIMIHVYNKQVDWPELGSADDQRFWRYFVARYQAFCNVIWDTAKESYYRPAEYIWYRLATLRQLDGYRRLVTVHDAGRSGRRLSPRLVQQYDPRQDLSDALADFKADQIHDDWYNDAVSNYLAAQRPYVNIEYGYEQGAEELPTYGVRQHWREVLRRTWLVTMGGAYANYYYSNTAWNLFVPEPEPVGYEPHRRYADFWAGTHYWTLSPDNGCLSPFRSGVYCRVDPGREYVIFDETGEGFGLTITGASAELRASWFNPITGERGDAGQFGNGVHRFNSPWASGNWAVLHLCSAEAER